ncbi:ring-opening amidohydrolase [Planotetraspora sp. GP83]|uniref:ring-opening amidohydrolase n=1 Tax=Planotetraspora sp. GP83 TaxID=3156264 RepID=UPI0035111CE4
MLDQSFAVSVFKTSLGHPSDVSGVVDLIEQGAFTADQVVAVAGKTEGTGATDDETRMAADRALRSVLSERGTRSDAQIRSLPMVFSSGAVGLLEPNVVVFVRKPCEPGDPAESRLTIGTSQTPVIRDDEAGRLPMVSAVARSVEFAASSAGITPRDATYILAKSKMPAAPEAASPQGGPAALTRADDMPTLLRTSGAAALGIGVAIGDVAMPREADIGTNLELWSGRASTSTGHENAETQVVLLGNRPGAGGSLRIGRAVMEDVLDVSSLNRAIRDAGLEVPETHVPDEIRRKVVAVFLKCATPVKTLRGRRQVQGDLNPHYIAQVKATVGGIFAAALGDPAVYISGAAIHQGPPGGGSVAVIVDKS